MTDLYHILEISKTADYDEIRRAYKQLSRKWHPDKNLNNQAEAGEKIKEINQAYNILSDPEKRKIYDRFGLDAVNKFANNQDNNPFSSAGFPPGFFPRGFMAHGFPPGFMPHFRQAPRDPLAQFHILEHELEVSLSDLYCGRTVEFNLNKRIKQHDGPPIISLVKQQFKIIKGMDYGVKYQIKGQGHYLDERSTGHLILIFKPSTTESSKFIKKGSDLYYPLKLSLKQILLGFSLPIVHLDKRVILIEHEGPIWPKKARMIENQGMPRLRPAHDRSPIVQQLLDFGDLYIDFEVDMPSKLTPEIEQQIKLILPDTELDKRYKINGEHTRYKFTDLVEKQTDEDFSDLEEETKGIDCRTQ